MSQGPAAASLLAVFAMLAGGAFLAVQAPANAALVRPLGSPVNAALASFVIGTIALALVAVALRSAPDLAAVRAAPWWAWVGGVCGAIFVAALALAAPRIGVAQALTLAIAAQLIVALALDHFGLMGLASRPVDWSRIAGVTLVCAGVLLVRRG